MSGGAPVDVELELAFLDEALVAGVAAVGAEVAVEGLLVVGEATFPAEPFPAVGLRAHVRRLARVQAHMRFQVRVLGRRLPAVRIRAPE